MSREEDDATVDLRGVDPSTLFRAAKNNDSSQLASIAITAEVLEDALKEKYERVCPMEGGGMACVFKAFHKLLNQWMVIKLPSQQYRSREDIERFVVEAKAIYELRDEPNIVRFTEVSQVLGVPYFAMERVEGKSLSKVMSSLSDDEKIRIGITVCEALAAVHCAKITHRDIKPDNIMITPTQQVKVIDFGIASMPDESSGQTFAGSPGYKAPEQGSKQPVDHRADIYSLGVTLCEMFTQNLKLSPESGACLAKGIADAIAKATQFLPENRFQSMAELAAVLRQVQTKSTPPPLPQKRRIFPCGKQKSDCVNSKSLSRWPIQVQFRHVAFVGLSYLFGSANCCFLASIFAIVRASRIAIKSRLACLAFIGIGWCCWLLQPVLPRNATATKPFTNHLGMKFVPLPGTSRLIAQNPTTKAELEQWLIYNANFTTLAKSVSGRSHWSYNDTAMAVTWEEADAFANWLSTVEKRRYRLPRRDELLQAFGPDGCELASALTDSRSVYTSKEPNRLGVRIVHYLWEWCGDAQKDDGLAQRRLLQAEPRPDNKAVVFPMSALPKSRSMLPDKPPSELNDFAFRLVLDLESK